MPLHPQVEKFLEEIRLLPSVDRLSPQQARKLVGTFRQAAPKFIADGVKISDRLLPSPHPSIPLRIYTPESQQTSLPIFLFFHGGGWVFGALEDFDRLCSFIAKNAECLVISVGYRLAPEYKFPTAVEDAYSALLWTSQQGEELGGDPSRIAVGGDSAGGNLATVLTLMTRERKLLKIEYQLLMYPVTNYAFDTFSYNEFANGYGLMREEMKWFWSHYLSHPDEGKNPYASPLQAETLQHLPPARVVIAEYDVLRSEAEAYCDRLEKHNVKVVRQFCSGLIHGFLSTPNLWEFSEIVLGEISTDLRGVFAGDS
ncbi:MAG: alpha/beta hydrolase [Cyanobacteria bacterium SBLK]|nr:alpha/beta hydrolase [Cyanobacteria bacterium SBLK]